jgi:hypothetical protein
LSFILILTVLACLRCFTRMWVASTSKVDHSFRLAAQSRIANHQIPNLRLTRGSADLMKLLYPAARDGPAAWEAYADILRREGADRTLGALTEYLSRRQHGRLAGCRRRRTSSLSECAHAALGETAGRDQTHAGLLHAPPRVAGRSYGRACLTALTEPSQLTPLGRRGLAAGERFSRGCVVISKRRGGEWMTRASSTHMTRAGAPVACFVTSALHAAI